LEEVGKTTKPFRSDLNQIPYDYTAEVTNRFKELDLIGRVREELWTEIHSIVHEALTKTIPKKKNLHHDWTEEELENVPCYKILLITYHQRCGSFS